MGESDVSMYRHWYCCCNFLRYDFEKMVYWIFRRSVFTFITSRRLKTIQRISNIVYVFKRKIWTNCRYNISALFLFYFQFFAASHCLLPHALKLTLFQPWKVRLWFVVPTISVVSIFTIISNSALLYNYKQDYYVVWVLVCWICIFHTHYTKVCISLCSLIRSNELRGIFFSPYWIFMG